MIMVLRRSTVYGRVRRFKSSEWAFSNSIEPWIARPDQWIAKQKDLLLSDHTLDWFGDCRKSKLGEDIMANHRSESMRIVVIPLAADQRFRPISQAEATPILRKSGVTGPYI
ncbi:MAG: hypothetical protein JSV68_06610, partial [Anaerolineaceae bacterium]